MSDMRSQMIEEMSKLATLLTFIPNEQKAQCFVAFLGGLEAGLQELGLFDETEFYEILTSINGAIAYRRAAGKWPEEL